MGIDDIFNLGTSIIERVWPDPIKRAEEVRKLEELKQKGDSEALNARVQLMLAQIDVNKEQAKSKSLFVAGARPALLWICALGLAYQFLLFPLLTWGWYIFMDVANNPPPPPLDFGLMSQLLMGMLGLGYMRSQDKAKGVQTDKLG